MTERKNFDWIDTIRVAATFIVIFFHYVYNFPENPNLHGISYKFFWGIADIGIPAFFGISGYLVVNSLEYSKSVLDFYRKKFIRVVLPFTASYIVVILMLLLLLQVNPQILTLLNPKHQHLETASVIGGLLPFDINMLIFFDVPHYFIVGEWFIGTIVLMYLISPLVYKLLKFNIPITMIALVCIAAATSNALTDLENQRRIYAVATFFLVRLPEFATGMVLFMNREKIFQRNTIITGIFLAGLMIFYTSNFIELNSEIGRESIWMSHFFGERPDLHFILAAMLTVYLSFVAANFLNNHFAAPMKYFNQFKDISYMAILIQHLVINLFAKILDFKTMNIIGLILSFVAIITVIIIISTIMKKVYTPFEKKLLNWH